MSSLLKQFLVDVQQEKNKQSKQKSVMSDEEFHRQNILNLKIIVILDISGSISVHVYNSFLSQLHKIRGLSKIRIFEVDTEICAMYDFDLMNSRLKNQIVRVMGGGGTDFVSAFHTAKACKPDAILLFTDGMDGNNLQNPHIPTGVVLTKNGHNGYPWMKEVGRLDT
jgi:predicted metal-dependent peptidase